MKKNKVLLAILDGWGKGLKKEADAIYQASTPFYDHLIMTYPNANLVTYGLDVGLPRGQMGNSEVGHLNIGAGRVVYQELARINKAIDENTLLKEKVIRDAIDYSISNDKPLHVLGLLSDGGVHSHIDHIIAFTQGASAAGVKRIYIHAFMDGRDTDPQGGEHYVKTLLEEISGTTGKLATIIGRYYAMDRDNRWERIKKAYDLLVNGDGEMADDPLSALRLSYAKGVTDEFIDPLVVDQEGLIKENDAVLFINFRTDRPRELVRVLTQTDMPEFGMKTIPLYFITMANYDKTFQNIHVVYDKDLLKNTLGEVLSEQGRTQVRIAETEKYPHVSFFFSGGREEPFLGEDRIMIPSPKVATYDLAPEMSAPGITSAIVSYIKSNHPDFICLNFANTDMVGHTGDFQAAMKAAETVDSCMKSLVETALDDGYEIIVIADHGNSDYMINEDGTPNTAHTTNLVPFIYVSNKNLKKVLAKDGKLADIAPTILSLMAIPAPPEMTGEILINTIA